MNIHVPKPVGGPTVSVIVPTCGEAENLRCLVPRLFAVLAEAGLEAELIVVDDNSPDETVAVCEALGREHAVRLEVRENERGLSSAVVHGMHCARGEMLVVMDADLSHPPEAVPQLVEALREGETDFVIGSRYVAGGSTEDSWGLFRRLNSRVATLLARPLTSARDPMAGFFALRRDRFLRHAGALNPIGYKIGLELIVKCGCRRIAEVPITFRNRLHGESKLTLAEQWRYVRHVGRLLKHRYAGLVTPAQFAAVGALGMAVDFALFVLLLRVLPLGTARALAIWGAMTFNFLVNRQWTFRDARRRPVGQQYALFCGGCGLGAALNWTVSVSLAAFVPFFADRILVAAAAGVAAGFVVNYGVSRIWAFPRGESAALPGRGLVAPPIEAVGEPDLRT